MQPTSSVSSSLREFSAATSAWTNENSTSSHLAGGVRKFHPILIYRLNHVCKMYAFTFRSNMSRSKVIFWVFSNPCGSNCDKLRRRRRFRPIRVAHTHPHSQDGVPGSATKHKLYLYSTDYTIISCTSVAVLSSV